jgi:CheY-like chemotaxis protein
MAKKFMIVDDDPDDTEIFCEAINEIDGSIVCFSALTGGDAIRKIDQSAPDVIFLDVNMPTMNGWEVLRKLKRDAEHRSRPVIMYSTSTHEEDVQHARQLGAVLFFVKPFDYEMLKKGLKVVITHMLEGTLSDLGPLFTTSSGETFL